MGDKAFLRAFIVIRRYHQQGIRAHAFRIFGKLHCIAGFVGAGTRDYGHTPLYMVDSKFDGCTMFCIAHRCGFTRSTGDDDGIRMVLYLVINNPSQLVKVNAIFRIRRNDGYACATKNRFFHEKASHVNILVPFTFILLLLIITLNPRKVNGDCHSSHVMR